MLLKIKQRIYYFKQPRILKSIHTILRVYISQIIQSASKPERFDSEITAAQSITGYAAPPHKDDDVATTPNRSWLH